MNKLDTVEDATFDKNVLNSKTKVLVLFGASWCAPCKKQTEILNSFIENYNGDCSFYKLDTDDSPLSTRKYNIRGVPVTILFESGNILRMRSGNISITELYEFVEE